MILLEINLHEFLKAFIHDNNVTRLFRITTAVVQNKRRLLCTKLVLNYAILLNYVNY